MAAKGLISYWWLPIISALVWVSMLLGLLLHWIIDDHHQPYDYEDPKVHVVFISNIGAGNLQPLFIAGSCIACFFLDASMLASRWLKHHGRLVPNDTPGQLWLAILTIIFAVIGTAGLILLSIFDTKDHHRLHYIFLLFFLGGYMLSAIFTCWEYQRLGIRHREQRNLRISFWVKLIIVLVETALAVGFVSTTFTKHRNTAAIIEWTVAFLFTLFILSFVIDLYPAVHTKSHANRYEKRSPQDVEEATSGTNSPYRRSEHNTTGAF